MTVNAQTMLELAVKKVLSTSEWPIWLASGDGGLDEHDYVEFVTEVLAALRSPAIAGVEAREAGKLLGAFRKVVSVMKGARNTADHLMCVWSDDMKAAEDVAAFLETLAALPPSQEVPAPPQADGVRAGTYFGDPVAAPPQRMWSAPAEFVMWVLMEGAWQGDDVDGGASQDKAVELGLIVATQYDPKKHGENAYCEPGDQWFVPSESLIAALSDRPGAAGREAYEIARHIIGYLGNHCGLCFSDVKQDDWDVIKNLVASAHPRPERCTPHE